jgi:hypothetical protein
MARQGGPVGPLGATMDALVGLNYISTLTIVSIVAMSVNGNKLAKSLTSQNQQKNIATKLETHTNAHAHPHKSINTRHKLGRKTKNATLFQQVLDEQWF